MFYETADNKHNLPFNPFKSCVIPRPIGWITSMDDQGNLNLAPYSYFNAISDVPPMVMFSATLHPDGRVKDTLRNVENTKEFVVNIATWELREAVNISSTDFPAATNEIEIVGLETVPSKLIKPPRLKASPIHLECVYHQSIQLPVANPKISNRLVIARVVGIHIADEIIVNGKIDITRFKPIARLGYMEYAVVDSTFVMERPYLEKSKS